MNRTAITLFAISALAILARAAEAPSLPWSFAPVKKPAVPAVKNAAWLKDGLDVFILAKLEAAGIVPNPDADRATLLRRASYDLTGLPPTPEEIAAFVRDSAPEDAAPAKVVDRLLASPRFGERWGRHWLDVVRYADSVGRTWTDNRGPVVFGSTLLFAGCTTTPVARGSRVVVTTPAQFYRHGPAQDSGFEFVKFASRANSQGPDLQLPTGAELTMVKREFGFSQVMMETGETGYVANEFIRPAPPIARVAPPPPEMRRPRRTAPERRRSVPPDRVPEERLDLSDIPLPLPS